MATWRDVDIELPVGASGEVRVSCPACTPTRKPAHQRERDLAVNVEKETWNCFHCGWTGGLRSGGGEPGRPMSQRPPSYAPPRPLPQVVAPTLWEKAVAWFGTRGIRPETMAAAGVMASVEYCKVCTADVGHIHFPYYVNGVHTNTKHRCGQKHFTMERGAQRSLYNIDAVRGAVEIVVVEGEMDVLALAEAGIPHVVSVPNGAPPENAKDLTKHFDYLAPAEEVFAAARRVILATDADAPGQKLFDELARRIGPEKCYRVEWDDGVKDANECLVKAGPDYLRTVIEDATPLPVEGIYTGIDLLADLDALYDHGPDTGVGCGYPVLDQYLRFQTGQLVVVTGIASHGKSTVLDQLLIRLADRHGWTFALFSPEQLPLVKHQESLIRQYAGMPFHKGYTARMSREEMHAANRWVAERFSFILPDRPTVGTILQLAKTQVYRNGIKGFVFDPWNQAEHERPRHLSETEYISMALTEFQGFARLYDVVALVVAHPTKMRRNEDGSEPIPTLWDISGSAHFRNKADVGLTVWRDLQANDNTVEIHVTKMRFTDYGQLGAVRFGYDAPSRRLYEIGPRAA